MKITFLHTAQVHVKRFDEIINKVNTSFEIEHWVNERLLTSTKETGELDKEQFDSIISAIRSKGESKVICTCSTYGSLCEESNAVYRIDKPIGTFLVSNYSKIGLAFTLPSTVEVSKQLLEGLAVESNKSIKIIEIDCSSSWRFFESGDIEKYELEIARRIKQEEVTSEAIFLAQASMEGAKEYLKEEAFQVVSSAEFGVRSYLDLFSKIYNQRSI